MFNEEKDECQFCCLEVRGELEVECGGSQETGYAVVGRCNKKAEGGGVRGAPRFRIYWNWDCHRETDKQRRERGVSQC